MKVGILTFHNTTNYGATLQAYALMQVIQSQGHEVELIDYRPYRVGLAYLKHLYVNKCFRFRYSISNTVKSWKMRQFLLSRMGLSKLKFYRKTSLDSWNPDYDVVVCGSDEIWELGKVIESIPLGTDFCLSYFFDFISNPKTRKVSYAPSCGPTKTFGNHREKVSQLLKNFHAISVRDAHSLKLLSEEYGIQATKVLDPTFLADFKDITASVPIQQKYILVYGALSGDEQNYVKAVADREELEIISIGYPCQVADVNRVDIGPEEWLGYYAQASYVFTSFYHGTIFSIIFNKPFTTFSRSTAGDNKSKKVQDLLKDLDIEDRLLNVNRITSPQPQLNLELNFDTSKLQQMIGKSNAYLSQALSA
ncbi:MAG: polysaccharide pyruvyl transferase family protein [Moorea sp. SIO3G5]|nr:polysaccharide pyruvyl transferase family protein [Moorena sp. SIO3G5]